MAACKRSKFEYPNHVDGKSLLEIVELSKERLEALIKNETTHPNTRFTWKLYLRLLNHNFCTKSTVEFWGDHLGRMFNFIMMSVKAQTLFLRMFTRTKRWHIVGKIDPVVMDPHDVVKSIKELVANGFAQKAEDISLDELLKLLLLEDLKKVCKQLNLEYKLRLEKLIENIKKFSKSQRSIFSTENMEKQTIKIALSVVGDCFNLDESFSTLLLALMTVYCPVTMNSALLFDEPKRILQSEFFHTFSQIETEQLIKHVDPDLVMRLNIYKDIEQLFEYLEAMEVEKKILKLLRVDKQAIVNMADTIQEKLLAFIDALTNEQELAQYYANLPDYHLCYTAPWIYARCLHTCADAYQTLKEHEKANNIFSLLINRECLKRFRVAERGYFYHRMALNLHSHLKDKETALKVCELALSDPLVADKHKLELQDRATKINKEFQLKINLEKWQTIKIAGNVLRKNLGDNRQNHFIIKNHKTGGFDNCSVEEIALQYFLNNGYTEGFHSEGRVWHLLYFLAFCDILLDISVEGVWISEFQRDPLDRNTKAFFTNRQKAIDEHIDNIRANPALLETLVELNFNDKWGSDSVECDWTLFTEVEQIKKFLSCCPREALLGIFSRFSHDNRHTRSGFPDLVVWNAETSEFAVIEVKGPNDSLSTKQRLCLDFFVRNGVKAIVCNVEASKDRIH